MVQETSVKEKVIIIAGPTASGKTGYSVEVAKLIGGEIISADSMQIYKHFDIGSAKVTEDEMQGIPHHMLSFCELNSEFSVSEFVDCVRQKISEINSRGKIPVVVGGTGLFIQSLLYPYSFSGVAKDESIRQKYTDLCEKHGNEYIYKLLKERDCERASKLHPNDVKRVIRALEVLDLGGNQNTEEFNQESCYDYMFLCLTMPREELYERINLRVDLMMKDGLLKEIKGLIEMGADWESQAMQGIGYKEWKPYFDGKATIEEVCDKIKQNTRNYAKRQLTWFRHRENVIWVEKEDRNNILNKILEKVKN